MFISKNRFYSMWILAIVILVITGTCELVKAAEPDTLLSSSDTWGLGYAIRDAGYTCDTAEKAAFLNTIQGDPLFWVVCDSGTNQYVVRVTDKGRFIINKSKPLQ
jgi:hypothetical protein